MQKTAVSLIALTASAAPAAAQTTETPEDKADSRTTIVVTGESFVGDEVVSANKDGGDILTTPQAISVVEDDFIDALNLRTVSEALNYTSGVRSQSFGNDTRIEYYQIRGFRNENLYKDGLVLTKFRRLPVVDHSGRRDRSSGSAEGAVVGALRRW